MSKIGREVLAQTNDDMGMPELSKEAFDAMMLDSVPDEFLPTPPSAFEVEKAHYDMWLWELTKYDDIHLIRELQDRGYDVRRDV